MNKIPNRQAICETLMEHAKIDKSITVLFLVHFQSSL